MPTLTGWLLYRKFGIVIKPQNHPSVDGLTRPKNSSSRFVFTIWENVRVRWRNIMDNKVRSIWM